METTIANDVVLATDILPLLPPIAKWSGQGFQHLIESGLLSDLFEVMRKNKVDAHQLLQKGMLGISKDRGTVTLMQMKRLLDVAPIRNSASLDNFIAFFKVWSDSSIWWDSNTLSWQLRDMWRDMMCLDRLNPIAKNEALGIELVYCRRRNYRDWYSVPEGYRYATVEEVDGASRDMKKDGKVHWIAVFCGPQDGDPSWIFYSGGVYFEYLPNDDGIAEEGSYVALVKL